MGGRMEPGREGLECQQCEEPQWKRGETSKLGDGTWGQEGRAGAEHLHEPAGPLGAVGPCAGGGSPEVVQHEVVQAACPGEARQRAASPEAPPRDSSRAPPPKLSNSTRSVDPTSSALGRAPSPPKIKKTPPTPRILTGYRLRP